MDQSSSNSPIHQLDYSNGCSSPLSSQSFNGTMLTTIKTTNSTNMQTNGSSSPSITSLETNHINKHSEAPKRLCLVCGDIASGFHCNIHLINYQFLNLLNFIFFFSLDGVSSCE